MVSVLYMAKSKAAEPAARTQNSSTEWGDGFSIVRIHSASDGSLQPAYFFASQPGISKPLVVSLHTWSGDYTQNDPLAIMVKNEGWNYIHPNFRGPNRSKDACLSKKAVSDIDDSIQYAISKGSVDPENIFVVGVSGGGYATLGMYLKTSHHIRAFLAWAAISDLSAWFYQSKSRYPEYAQDILQSTSDGIHFDENEARRRSPLFWDMPAKPKGRLEIFEGINDGYTGSVPISQSILFFNRIVMHYGYPESRVGEADMVKLLTGGIERKADCDRIEGRDVLYERNTAPVSLTIFDGGHEMLAEYCFGRMKSLAGQGAAGSLKRRIKNPTEKSSTGR